eukprot:scaffold149719_cov32-Tisochrysis_lutea.AAC.5
MQCTELWFIVARTRQCMLYRLASLSKVVSLDPALHRAAPARRKALASVVAAARTLTVPDPRFARRPSKYHPDIWRPFDLSRL